MTSRGAAHLIPELTTVTVMLSSIVVGFSPDSPPPHCDTRGTSRGRGYSMVNLVKRDKVSGRLWPAQTIILIRKFDEIVLSVYTTRQWEFLFQACQGSLAAKLEA